MNLKKAETSVAILLTIAAIWLRAIAAFSAGALWRDEANTIGLATLPSSRDVWANLQFDSFPILWLIIIRSFATVVGVMNDPAFRLLGFIVGVGIIASLWFYAWALRYSLPLVSLALFVMNPSVVVWADTVRAYGFGILLIVLTGALLWRFVERPTTVRWTLAAIASVASVHTLYYNSVLLLAFTCGAVAVCVDKRSWRTAFLIIGIGVIAAISLVPYADTIRNASSWNMLVQVRHFGFLWFLNKLSQTVSPAGALWPMAVWIELLLVALVASARAVFWQPRVRGAAIARDLSMYAGVTLIVGLPVSFLFLRALSYWTQPWYYLTLLVIAAVCIDAVSGAAIHSIAARKVRLGAVVLLGAATFIAGRNVVTLRMTNVDAIASDAAQLAGERDLVVVNPWFYGVTFDRYYHGSAHWMTVPPIEFHAYHRYDLIKQEMAMPDQGLPLAPLENAIRVALQGGFRVFIVGAEPVVPPGERAQPLPPAPLPGNRWPEDRYSLSWQMETGYFLQSHSTKITTLKRTANNGVSQFENAALVVASGWRP